MDFLRAYSRCCLRIPSSITERLVRTQQRRHVLVHKTPCAHVVWFFLDPHDVQRSFIPSQDLGQFFGRKRVQLFNTDNGRVRTSASLALSQEIVVDLAATQQQPRDLLGIRAGRLVQDCVKHSLCEVCYRRNGQTVTQEALGGHYHQRLTEIALHLPPQEVKELRWSGAVCYLDIVLGAEL